MNSRTCEIKVRLTPEEMAHLNRLVTASKLSREAYLRKLMLLASWQKKVS